VRLIIDTDAGVDDAQAIMMALTHRNVTVEAITTVTGNVHNDYVVPNVFTVLDLMGHKNVPVYRGSDQPLVPGFWEAETRVHGVDGLGDIPNRKKVKCRPEAEPAAVALVRLANEYPGELTLIALGPLTNLALACRLDPLFPGKIKHFTWMGGSITALGNTPNATAEFNAYCDPEAALMVLEAFPNTTLVSWETTIQHPFVWQRHEMLININTQAGRFFRDITAKSTKFLKGFSQLRGFLLPDPLAMAVTLDPDLIRHSEQHFVTVELSGARTRGMTIVDYMSLLQRDPNTNIVMQIDIDGVYALYERMLKAV
jgi:purine nucleosidase